MVFILFFQVQPTLRNIKSLYKAYHDIEHKGKNVDVEVGVIVDKLGENKHGFKYREVEGVDDTKNPEEYLTEIQIPLK